MGPLIFIDCVANDIGNILRGILLTETFMYLFFVIIHKCHKYNIFLSFKRKTKTFCTIKILTSISHKKSIFYRSNIFWFTKIFIFFFNFRNVFRRTFLTQPNYDIKYLIKYGRKEK